MEICQLDVTDPAIARDVVAVQQSGYAVEAALIGFEELPPMLESAADVARLDVAMLGARDRAELVGLVGYTRAGDVVDVDRLVVHAAHFRRGIGTALLTELHRREAAACRFHVSTGAANVPGIRLYQRLGYAVDRTEMLSVGLEIVHLVRSRA